MNSVRRTCQPPPTSRFATTTYGMAPGPSTTPYGPSTTSHVAPSTVIGSEATVCDPWGSLVKCPLYIYIALSLVGFYITWQALLGNDKTKGSKGSKQGKTSRETTATVGLVLYAVMSIIFGMIIYNQCRKCDNTNAWFWLIIALLAPFIIVALVIGILSFVFGFAIGWSGTKNVKKSGKGKVSG